MWVNVTQAASTFYLSLDLLVNSSIPTLLGCAGLCAADAKCTYWAWCPDSATLG